MNAKYVSHLDDKQTHAARQQFGSSSDLEKPIKPTHIKQMFIQPNCNLDKQVEQTKELCLSTLKKDGANAKEINDTNNDALAVRSAGTTIKSC